MDSRSSAVASYRAENDAPEADALRISRARVYEAKPTALWCTSHNSEFCATAM